MTINIINIIGAILLITWIILVINQIIYICKQFKLDIENLKQKKKNKIAGTRVNTIKNGTFRYAPKIAQGDIQQAGDEIESEIKNKKVKFRYDLIKSVFTSIINLNKKIQ